MGRTFQAQGIHSAEAKRFMEEASAAARLGWWM